MQAITATSDLFSEDDAANKILPALCSALIDKEKIVRDAANKAFDVYLARIRKYASTLPETVIPPPSAAPTISAANGTAAVPRMGTPQTDSSSWAGWAISSFTNKLAAASGEMEAKPANPLPPTTSPSNRSSSVPPRSSTELKPSLTASASDLHRQAVNKPVPPVFTRTSTDQFFGDAQTEDDELDAAWSEMGEDSFFDAPSKPSVTSPTPFDDGGEPDFAGWLNAQTQAKVKSQLPRGLSKSGSTKQGPSGTKTAVIVGGKKVVPKSMGKEKEKPSSKAIDTKPKDADDDWGDAWD